MSRDVKPQIYHLVRRGWHDQLLRFCDAVIQKKGKDPVAIYWKAYALGMQGNLGEAKRQLDSFSQRRDMQLPVTLALLYFHKRAPQLDREVIETLTSELGVAEDVTKEAGLVLAARFSMYTNDTATTLRLTQRLLSGCKGQPQTAFELEAQCCEQWVCVNDAIELLSSSSSHSIGSSSSGSDSLPQSTVRQLQAIESCYRGRTEQADTDALMCYTRSKLLLRQPQEALALLNQIIAYNSSFTAALQEKASILAASGEWEQALDAAQRALDLEPDCIDALRIIAMHAFTQEAYYTEAHSKLEDVDAALRAKESSCECALETATLFSQLCSRQSKSLQLCAKMIERALKSSPDAATDARLLYRLGQIQVMLGVMQYESAMKNFKEASKRDANCVQALEGMVLCQLVEGLYEDAEGQIELLSVMHSSDELSPEFRYLQSLLAKYRVSRGQAGGRNAHLDALDECRERLLARANRLPPMLFPFQDAINLSPDFLMSLAVEYLSYLEPPEAPPLFVKASSDSSSGSDSDGTNDGPSSSGGSSTGSSNSGLGETNAAGATGMELLQRVLRMCPGMTAAYIEQARCHASQGNYEEAMRSLHSCLGLQPHCSSALIVMARLECQRLNTSAANRALEQALSSDFGIRSNTLFRLVQVVVRAQQGKIDEAIADMEQLMGLPEIRSSNPLDAIGLSDGGLTSSTAGKGTHTDTLRLTDDDRVSAFVAYAALLGKTRRLKEANKVLQEARVLFVGTKQEVQIMVAGSQLAIERNDFDSAIRMLDKIAPESPIFTRAMLIKADIMLTHNRDKEAFTQCYHRLVDSNPSAKTYALLGEAYIRILQPEAAVEALEQAYKLDPSNVRLRGRIGRALVSTHEYHRAVDFYEAAIRDVSKTAGSGSIEAVALSRDLASLYVKLDRREAALRCLQRSLNTATPSSNAARDVSSNQQDVATLLLIADIQGVGAGSKGGASSSSDSKTSDFDSNADTEADNLTLTLNRAKEMQTMVVSQARTTTGLSIDKERSLLSDIYGRVGAVLFTQGDISGAAKTFEECLHHNPQSIVAMLGLARIYRLKGELDQCRQQCTKILLAYPAEAEAAIMLSDTIFHSQAARLEASEEKSSDDGIRDFNSKGRESSSSSSVAQQDTAADPLEALLKLRPGNFKALEKLIVQYGRSGTLDKVPPYLAAAQASDGRAESQPGYHYCLGLYARYTNDVGKAICEFNLARRDPEWAEEALLHMIELYLNPNQDNVWEEREQGPLDEATAENIAAADSLLRELKPIAKDQRRVKVIEAYCLLATRSKSNVEKAMGTLAAMLEADQDYLPAVLGMATGFMVDTNKHKAQNLLKRVQKLDASQGIHDGQDFTKANLLLAKFYVDKTKYDQAQDICKRTLARNKSCSQAWDILGLVMEKESNYERAAECYEKSWKLEFELSAASGFRLAYAYLKCRRLVECIDICEVVLGLYPDYPRIREEILKKAQSLIRSTN